MTLSCECGFFSCIALTVAILATAFIHVYQPPTGPGPAGEPPVQDKEPYQEVAIGMSVGSNKIVIDGPSEPIAPSHTTNDVVKEKPYDPCGDLEGFTVVTSFCLEPNFQKTVKSAEWQKNYKEFKDFMDRKFAMHDYKYNLERREYHFVLRVEYTNRLPFLSYYLMSEMRLGDRCVKYKQQTGSAWLDVYVTVVPMN